MSNFEMVVTTVGAPYGYAEHISEDKKFAPMQMVWGEDIEGRRVNLAVVLTGPIDIPYFEDGVASAFCQTPLDITNPEEWRQTFRCYLVFDLTKQVYALCNYQRLSLFDEKHPHNSYVMYDNASAQLRVVKGLFKMSDAADEAA